MSDQREGCEIFRYDPPPDPLVTSFVEAKLAALRSVSPDVTVEKVLAKAEIIGLTRLSDLAGVDRVHIPNFSAICPKLNWPPIPGMVSVFSGKGVSRASAKASALMEAVERYSAIHRNEFALSGTYNSLHHRYDLVDPTLCVSGFPTSGLDNVPLEWVTAESLRWGHPVLVPSFLVFVPYRPHRRGVWIGPGTSNGLASGNNASEAILHALYEIIERDAIELSLVRRRITSIDVRSLIEAGLGGLVTAFPVDVKLEIRDITSDIGVPVYEAVIRGYEARMQELVSVGQGSHLSPIVAMVRAICEASQSRVTAMSGIREDLQKRKHMKALGGDWLDVTTTRTFDEAFSLEGSTVDPARDIARILERLWEAGIEDVYAVDLTRPELEIPVVRLLAPGLEPGVEGRRAARVAEHIA